MTVEEVGLDPKVSVRRIDRNDLNDVVAPISVARNAAVLKSMPIVAG